MVGTMSSFGRAVGILRSGSGLFRPRRIQIQKIQKRNGGGGPHIEPRYRQAPEITKKQLFEAEFLTGAMWFWILWHCWHDPDAVLGHFPYPDSSQWTDEELGIPADDEE